MQTSGETGTTRRYAFDEFVVEPSESRLLHCGTPVHCEPKALRVLQVLLRAQGQLVLRDALLDEVWGRTIVTPGTLTRLIAGLRKLLGDSSGKPRYISTVHTRGYRWVGPAVMLEPVLGRSNLPERITPLIGRHAELAALESMLERSRLITLAGPGGTGKTALAFELMRQRESRGEADMLWVDVSTASDALSFERMVLAALDARENEARAIVLSIAAAIGDRRIDLLLDNCEHVVRTAASLARTVLARCPRLKVVCTSQVILDVPDEQVFWVQPLGLPRSGWDGADDPVGAVVESDALRLLEERARSVLPDFRVDSANASCLADICQRLDGLPLALELAAARLVLLTPQQLLRALDDRFAILARHDPQPSQRHASLQGAIEWSFGLLEPLERELLARLSIFKGSFDLDAAIHVLDAHGGKSIETLDGLQSLARKSLLTVQRQGGMYRYRLLDSIAAYVRAGASGSNIVHAARLRHAQYYAQLASRADAALLGSEQALWLHRLINEWQNLTHAFEWALHEPAARQHAVDIAVGLRWFFWIRGMYGEALQWYRALEEWLADFPQACRARLLNGVAVASLHACRHADAQKYATLAEKSAAAAHEPWEGTFARAVACWNAGMARQFDSVDTLFAAVQAQREPASDSWLLAIAGLGPAYREILSGNAAGALSHLEPLRSLLSESPDAHMRMYVCLQCALQRYLLGHSEQAARLVLEGFELCTRNGSIRGFVGVCELSAYLIASHGHPADATRMLGAADFGREQTQAPQAVHWTAPHAAVELALRGQMTAAEFAARFSAGRRVQPAQAAADAAELLRRIAF